MRPREKISKKKTVKAGKNAKVSFADLVMKLPMIVGTEESRTGFDPELDEDERVVIARRITRAVQQLKKTAPRAEIARFRAVERAALRKGTLNFATDDEYLWLISFHLWGRYLEAEHEGDASVLRNLHPWLTGFCGFFLRQWWVSELIHSWYHAGQRQKLERLFFGRHGNRFQRYMVDGRRNWWIVRRVDWHRETQKLGVNQALKRVQQELAIGQYEGAEKKSVASIRTIYYEHPYSLASRHKLGAHDTDSH